VSRIRVGCSGWVYDDWREPVYAGAPPRRWLEIYAEQFDTVEINATFYRLPAASTVEQWARRVPDGFVFCPKLGQYCSHRKKLKDPDQWLARHLERVRVLGSRLGPNLVQLPPRWRRNVDRLDEFLRAVPDDIRWAVEVRDRSWLHDDVFACLERHGAALCIHDMLDDHPWLLTTSWTYLRFHGPEAPANPYRGRYGARRLAAIAERLDGWRDDGIDVWAYFNNDFSANAWHDATWLRDRTRP
jgi:uncharacterized protein YecE (DUF72 family)